MVRDSPDPMEHSGGSAGRRDPAWLPSWSGRKPSYHQSPGRIQEPDWELGCCPQKALGR